MRLIKSVLTISLGLILGISVIAGPQQDPDPAKPDTPPRPAADNPPIPFPQDAVDLSAEGTAEYRVDVDASGRVIHVEVVDVPRIGVGFEQAIRGTVARWRFEPATRGGEPVAGRYTGTTRFLLTVPYSTGRMYSLPSGMLWEQVVTLLKELGLAFETIDRENGVIVTRWKKPAKIPGLGAFRVEDRIVAKRFRLHMFVSPFAEPGRLYVGSMVYAVDNVRGYRVYNVDRPQEWFFERIASWIDQPGLAIPRSPEARYGLARRLLGESNPDACQDRYLNEAILTGQNVSPPHRIKSSYVEPIYPEASRLKRRTGKVIVMAELQEDGWIGDVKVIRSDTGDTAFHVSAANTVSYWRYHPFTRDGCPVPGPLAISVTYSLR